MKSWRYCTKEGPQCSPGVFQPARAGGLRLPTLEAVPRAEHSPSACITTVHVYTCMLSKSSIQPDLRMLHKWQNWKDLQTHSQHEEKTDCGSMQQSSVALPHMVALDDCEDLARHIFSSEIIRRICPYSTEGEHRFPRGGIHSRKKIASVLRKLCLSRRTF